MISDIHGNLNALQSVLDDAGHFHVAVCAGDIVGYGPDPRDCLKVVKRICLYCVKGNHDHAIVDNDTSRFNVYASEALSINKRSLDVESIAGIRSLPIKLSFNIGKYRVAVFHGSPKNPIWEYVFPSDAERMIGNYFKEVNADLMILGHTHVPYINKTDKKTLINPGSVGQPRDGDPRASYMLVDVKDEFLDIKYRRVEYDVKEVASKMRRLGLPEILAHRLNFGR